MSKQILERGLVPEMGDISSLPFTFETPPEFNVSGGNANMAHHTPDGDALSLFSVWIESLTFITIQVDLCLGDASGELEVIILNNLGDGYFSLPFERKLSSFASGNADRYSFKCHLDNATVEYYGALGLIASPAIAFPTSGAIATDSSVIGVIPVPRQTQVVDLFGDMAPGPYFSGLKYVYDMLSKVGNEFDNVSGHDHDGTDAKKVSHSSLNDIVEDSHHAKIHGAGEHSGNIGSLSQISDIVITAANLDALDDGADTSLHFHDADRALANATGSLVESQVTFDNAAGHEHDGIDAKKVNPANLENCPNVSSIKLDNMCSGATISETVHRHDKLTQKTVQFGMSPEYGNAVFDNDGLLYSFGTWLGGYETASAYSFLSWTSMESTLQSHRVRIAVKLPSDFGAWATSPVRFSHKEEGSAADVEIAVSMTLPNGTVTSLSPLISKSVGAWSEYTVSSIGGAYAANEWFVVTIGVGAKNSSTVKLGRIDFSYLTNGFT